MKILNFDTIDSTQTYLKEQLKIGNLASPICISSEEQSAGHGRRGTPWLSARGNIFISFAHKLDEFSFVPKSAYAIYFAYIMKETLVSYGSNLYLKWPNDFYIEDKKIGGIIVEIESNNIIVGIGLNLVTPDKKFDKLDIKVNKADILKFFFINLEKKETWSIIKDKYLVELYKRNYVIHTSDNKKIFIKDTTLNDDGSLDFNGERIYSRL